MKKYLCFAEDLLGVKDKTDVETLDIDTSGETVTLETDTNYIINCDTDSFKFIDQLDGSSVTKIFLECEENVTITFPSWYQMEETSVELTSGEYRIQIYGGVVDIQEVDIETIIYEDDYQYYICSGNKCRIEPKESDSLHECVNFLGQHPELTEIQISSSFTSIGSHTFEQCTSLILIEIPNSVTSIWNSTFEGCTSLTSIEIPNSVTYIGENTFNKCTSLASIAIPDSVTSIGYRAFYEVPHIEYYGTAFGAPWGARSMN